MSSTVGLRDVPDAIRRINTLTKTDYVDVFTLSTGMAGMKTAEEWARAALEDTPTGRSAPILWRFLGLRLGPRPSREHVQGWAITGRGEDWIRIAAASWFMTANAVVKLEDGQLSIALFVRYDRPIAALIWPPVSIMHRRAMPALLCQALKVGVASIDQIPHT